MSTTAKNAIGSAITAIAGTVTNALANNAYALGGSAINWTQGQTADGYLMGRVQLLFKFAVAPSAQGSFYIWFCKSNDGGGTFEDTAAGPPRIPDLILGVTPFAASGDTSSHIVSVDVPIPVGSWKALLQNSGTGQALAATNTDTVLTVVPITPQSI